MINKILLKSFFFMTLIATTLFASSSPLLLNDINQIYSVKFYDGYNEIKNRTIKNFENNTTQKKIKEDFENLLSSYLNENDLFSKENYNKMLNEDENIKQTTPLFCFINSSLTYISYLKSIDKIQKAKKLMEKNLVNLEQLLKNSDNNLIAYLVAMNYYDAIYSNAVSASKDFIAIFKKYPPPNKSILFEKIKKDKDNVLDMFDEEFINRAITDKERKLFLLTRKSVIKYLNLNYEKKVVAIKSKSPEKMKEYCEYLEKEREEYTYERLCKVLSATDITPAEFVAKVIGKFTASMVSPKLDGVYQEHIKIVKKYNLLVK